MNLQDKLRSYAEKARSRREDVAADALLEAARMLDAMAEQERRKRDVATYDEVTAKRVQTQLRQLEGVIPLLQGLRREPSVDGWRLSQKYVEAYRLPTPEQALRALGAKPDRVG